MASTSVDISDKAIAILELCKEKEKQNAYAQKLNNEAREIIDRLKFLSDEQKRILESISVLDETIEKISRSCN